MLNFLDGLYKLAKLDRHAAYQIAMSICYVILSVRLIQLILGGPEEHLVGLRARQQHDRPIGQAELAHAAALRADSTHKADGITAQLLEMTRGSLPTRDPRWLAQIHRTFTVVGKVAKPRTLTEWTRRMPSGSMS